MVVVKASASGGDLSLRHSGFSRKAFQQQAGQLEAQVAGRLSPAARLAGPIRAGSSSTGASECRDRSRSLSAMIGGHSSADLLLVSDSDEDDSDEDAAAAPKVETEQEETERLRLQLKEIAARKKRLMDESAKHRAVMRQAQRLGLRVPMRTDTHDVNTATV